MPYPAQSRARFLMHVSGRFKPGRTLAMDVQTESLVVGVLDRALLDVQGRTLMSRSEVIDLLLDLRTVVDDIVRLACLESDTSASDSGSRFLRGHHRVRHSALSRG